MKRVLAIMLAAVLLLALIPAVSMAGGTATVIGGWLRLRAQPSLNATVITSYYTGTVVTVLDGPTNGWYHVRTSDNRVGYMSAAYLKPGGSPVVTNAYVTSYNGGPVNLRSGPSTSYAIIRSYAVGTPVTVLKWGNTWSQVSIYGRTGYMMSQYLTGTSPTPVPVVCTATIWAANGYGVRLRTGAGTGYSVIGKYPVGTKVDVLKKGAVWDYIRVGSRTGWMMNEFLIYNSGNKVTSVTVNNMAPAVNDTLYALSIQPSGATVSYQWLVGGAVRGTAANYTVTAADAGKSIQLTVTGTGAYTGTATSAATAPVTAATKVTGVVIDNNSPVVGSELNAIVTPSEAVVSYIWFVDGVQVSNSASYTVQPADAGKAVQVMVTGISPFEGVAVSAQTAPVAASMPLTSATLANITNSERGSSAPQVGDTLRALFAPTGATVYYTWMRNGAVISGETSQNYTLTAADQGASVSVLLTAYGSYSGSKSAASGIVQKAADIPVIITTSLPDAYVGVPYSASLAASGSGVIWSLDSGYPLPSGLTLSATGVISGIPSVFGSATIKVIAANADGSDVKEFPLTVQSSVPTPPPASPDLAVEDVIFGSVEKGTPVAPQSIRITNNGSAAASNVIVAVDSSAFLLTSTVIPSVASGAVDETIQIEPAVTAPGTYSGKITVTCGSQIREANVSLTITDTPAEPLKLNVTSDKGTTVLSGAEVLLTAVPSGGTGTYTYHWAHGETTPTRTVAPTTTTMYEVTVSDGVNSVTASITITVTTMTLEAPKAPELELSDTLPEDFTPIEIIPEE